MEDERTVTGAENRAYFNIQSPIQGLTLAIGGINIISCIVEKINRVRNLAHGENKEEDLNETEEETRNESLINLALNVFTDLKGRIENRVRALSSKTIYDSGRSMTQSDCSGEAVGDEDRSEIIEEDHYTVCGKRCTHVHHAHISTWKHPMLIHYTHVPDKLQEPYIHHGYLLPFMPWRYYLKALYTPNYELMNIWTHLIPSIYFMYLLITFAHDIDIRIAWPLLTITLCASILTLLSALAHMFHARSSVHHSCWFMVDYFGITVYAFSTILCNFYTGALLKYYELLSGCYVYIAIVICAGGFCCLCITQTSCQLATLKLARQMKVYVNALGYFFGALPLFQRIFKNMYDGREELALWYHGLAMLSLISAPIIYATDFPQKYWPGKFNIFGHSHQIFHILTALAAYFDISAIYYDVTEGPWKILHQQDGYPMLDEVLRYYGLLLMFGIISGSVIRYVIKDDYVHEEPFLKGEVKCECGLPETARCYTENNEKKPEMMSKSTRLARRNLWLTKNQ